MERAAASSIAEEIDVSQVVSACASSTIPPSTGSTLSACVKDGQAEDSRSSAILAAPLEFSRQSRSIDIPGFCADEEFLKTYAKLGISADEMPLELPTSVTNLFQSCLCDIQELLVLKKSFHGMLGGAKTLLQQQNRNSIIESVRQILSPETQRIGLLLGTTSQMIMWPTTDTDGPAGCFALAHVLAEMGKKVLILTDDNHFGQVYPAFLRSRVRNRSPFDRRRQVMMERFPVGEDWEDMHDSALEVTFGILDHIVNVGRLGPAADNHFYANTGHDATHHEPRFYNLFHWAEESKKHERPVHTTTLGELGNELGMSALRDVVIENLPKGRLIASVQAADNVIVATCVNWAAFGLAAAIAVYHAIQQKARGQEVDLNYLLPDEEENQEVLITLVDEAARCGISGTRDLWVDRYPLKKQAKMIRRIKNTAGYYYSAMVQELSKLDSEEVGSEQDEGKNRDVPVGEESDCD